MPRDLKELIDQISDLSGGMVVNCRLHAGKGNKTAGVRARSKSLELEKLLKQYRKLSIAADAK